MVRSMLAEYIALGVILAVALYFFWTQKLRTDLLRRRVRVGTAAHT